MGPAAHSPLTKRGCGLRKCNLVPTEVASYSDFLTAGIETLTTVGLAPLLTVGGVLYVVFRVLRQGKAATR